MMSDVEIVGKEKRVEKKEKNRDNWKWGGKRRRKQYTNGHTQEWFPKERRGSK